jgi:hypothetical protein
VAAISRGLAASHTVDTRAPQNGRWPLQLDKVCLCASTKGCCNKIAAVQVLEQLVPPRASSAAGVRILKNMRQSLQSAVPLLALALLVSQANAFVPAAPALPAMATAAARVLSRSQGEHQFVIRGAPLAVHLDVAVALKSLFNA